MWSEGIAAALGGIAGVLLDRALKRYSKHRERVRLKTTLEYGHASISGEDGIQKYVRAVHVRVYNESKKTAAIVDEVVHREHGSSQSLRPLAGTLPKRISPNDSAKWSVQASYEPEGQGYGGIRAGQIGVTLDDGTQFFSAPYEIQEARLVGGD